MMERSPGLDSIRGLSTVQNVQPWQGHESQSDPLFALHFEVWHLSEHNGFVGDVVAVDSVLVSSGINDTVTGPGTGTGGGEGRGDANS
jgi:hypothetical protein